MTRQERYIARCFVNVGMGLLTWLFQSARPPPEVCQRCERAKVKYACHHGTRTCGRCKCLTCKREGNRHG